jgi:hypothetical protein
MHTVNNRVYGRQTIQLCSVILEDCFQKVNIVFFGHVVNLRYTLHTERDNSEHFFISDKQVPKIIVDLYLFNYL